MGALFNQSSIFENSISPWLEMGAYEYLWAQQGTTYKSIADLFRKDPSALLSDFAPYSEAMKYADEAFNLINKLNSNKFGVRVSKSLEYPYKIRQAEHPNELLYYQGFWELTESKCVAVVGTRNPTSEAIIRTKKLVAGLIESGVTIVSGLAKGIDTAAHETTLELKGKAIAVIGTPISNYYPKTNKSLQEKISKEFLLVSPVPVVSYAKMPLQKQRLFFPERNVTMSALTEATIIVEAGETSGTLRQAHAALKQGRKLFILNSCFENKNIKWPSFFEERGAVRVKNMSDIIDKI